MFEHAGRKLSWDIFYGRLCSADNFISTAFDFNGNQKLAVAFRWTFNGTQKRNLTWRQNGRAGT